MPEALARDVEVLRVTQHHALHDHPGGILVDLHQQGEVIRHEEIRVEAEGLELFDDGEEIQKDAEVAVALEDRLPAVSSGDDMEESSRVMDPRRASHTL